MLTIDILRQYLPLCWFKHNPLELTRSVGFFRQNLIFHFVVYYFMQANMTDDPLESLYEVGFETLLTLLFVGIMLFLNKTLYAFVQVSTAIWLSANIISLFIVPVIIWLTVSDDPLSYYIFFLLCFWYFLLISYIIKKVVGINFAASMVIAILYFVTTHLGAFGLGQLM